MDQQEPKKINNKESHSLVTVEANIFTSQQKNTSTNRFFQRVFSPESRALLVAAGISITLATTLITQTDSIDAQAPQPTIIPVTLPDGRVIHYVTYDTPGVTQVNNQVVEVRVGPDGRVFINGQEVNNNDNNNGNNNSNENNNNNDNRGYDNHSGDNEGDNANDGDNNNDGDNGDNN